MSLVFRLSQRNNLRQSSTVGDRKKILVLRVLWEVMRPGDFFLFLSEDGGGGGDYAKELCKGIMQRKVRFLMGIQTFSVFHVHLTLK